MVGDVVDVGILSKELRTLLEVDAHDDAIGLGGFIGRNAGEELPTELQRRRSICGAGNDIR